MSRRIAPRAKRTGSGDTRAEYARRTSSAGMDAEDRRIGLLTVGFLVISIGY